MSKNKQNEQFVMDLGMHFFIKLRLFAFISFTIIFWYFFSLSFFSSDIFISVLPYSIFIFLSSSDNSL